jgi:two-component system response regulator DctR
MKKNNKNITTVILDSDPAMLQLHREIVEEISGYAVTLCAVSAASVLETLSVEGRNLLLLDLILPDTDGISFIIEIRRRELPVDIVAITSLKATSVVEKAFRLGVFDYIIKPYQVPRLKFAVEAYFARRQTLVRRTEVDQAWIDGFYTVRRPSIISAERLPKGFHRLTMTQVISFLAEKPGSVSAEEVARGIGFSRATARRYLEYLVRAGVVASELQYGSVGRPTTRYRLTYHKE